MPTPTSDQPANRTLDIYPNVPMEFVRVNPGTFIMGDAKDGAGYTGEKHEHLVRITQPFYLGRYAVTQGQWGTIMGNNPADFKGDEQRPVENVSWEDIVNGSGDGEPSFLSRLQPPPDHHFRLPTEAEWEYAAKGGHLATQPEKLVAAASLYPTYAGGEDVGTAAWQVRNNGYSTIRSGYRQPNDLGLYGMSGNVYDWCQDTFDEGAYAKRGEPTEDPLVEEEGQSRLLRGGSWIDNPWYCRPADRAYGRPRYRLRNNGFRLVLASSSGAG